MRQIRTVIRSLVTANGYIVAMDDGTIAWNPKNGQHKRTKISAQASVMLGLMNPFGEIDRVRVYAGSTKTKIEKLIYEFTNINSYKLKETLELEGYLNSYIRSECEIKSDKTVLAFTNPIWIC